MRDPFVPTPRRRLVVVGLLAVALAACGDAPQTVLDPAGPFADQPDDLFRVVVLIALAVFIVVQGLLVYTVIRYRDRGDATPEPEQVHGNTRLELVWTIIPALILAGIAVPTVQTVFDLAEPCEGAKTVQVIGHRWWWEYQYPDDGGIVTANELVIPAGERICLEMTSQEQGGPTNAVLHSYWVPALAGKQDVAPGRITTLNMQADEPGVFMGQCTEYCGLSHANMRNYATVLSPADFATWVDEQSQPAPAPEPGTLAERGSELFVAPFTREDNGEQIACIQCHVIDGGGIDQAGAIVGPNLTHLMSREMFAGSIFDLYVPDDEDWGGWTDEPNVDQLAAWVDNAPALKPMRPDADRNAVGMPNLEMTAEERDALVAYLLSLE